MSLVRSRKPQPNPEVITILLKAGANIKAQDKDGTTALTFATQNNHNPAVITALLKASADINAQDKDGTIALMEAAMKNHNPKVITPY